MKKKSFRISDIALLALSMSGFFTSCNNEYLVNTNKQIGDLTLKFTLNPQTRGAVYKDPGIVTENKRCNDTIEQQASCC
ncbi:hypothetical protein [Xylanibacter oryzae]|uniref:hypothetical protein n=1 Tax=Xylanibacter oryzae TaxID=185293 RepID=UPI0012B5CB09|nr:hypothetical protein [Xylanibacter oryzae]